MRVKDREQTLRKKGWRGNAKEKR